MQAIPICNTHGNSTIIPHIIEKSILDEHEDAGPNTQGLRHTDLMFLNHYYSNERHIAGCTFTYYNLKHVGYCIRAFQKLLKLMLSWFKSADKLTFSSAPYPLLVLSSKPRGHKWSFNVSACRAT